MSTGGAVDIATLGLEVRSDGVVVASQRLRELESQGGRTEAATRRMASSFDGLVGYIKAAAAAMAAWKITEYAKDAILLASRVETLSVVMNVVGNNAGYSRAQMEGFAKQIQKMGITTQESMNSLIKMAGAQMDLTKAAQLARVAQDAAVIGNINSSEAFGRMIQGIRSGETEILKGIGINVNLEQSYQKLASQIGKNSKDLTELEKITARTNAVLDYGKNITGAYEASMGTAGKQILSMSRYMEELKLKLGQTFSPVLTAMVMDLVAALKQLDLIAGDAAEERSGFGQWLVHMYELAQREGNMVLGWLAKLNEALYRLMQLKNEFKTGILGEAGYRFGARADQLSAYASERFQAVDRYDQKYRGPDGLPEVTNNGAKDTTAEQKRLDAAKAAEQARKTAEAQQQAAENAKQWRKTYADLDNEIANLNPTLDEHARKINDINFRMDELKQKSGASSAEIEKRHVALIAGTNAMRDYADALSIQENMDKAWEGEQELRKNRAQTEADFSVQLLEQQGLHREALQLQIEQENTALREKGLYTDQVAKLKEKVDALRLAAQAQREVEELSSLNYQNAQLQTSLIEDPYERQKQSIKDRYEYEMEQAEKAWKKAEAFSKEEAALEKKMALLKKEYIRDTTDVETESFKSRLGMAGAYTGMAGQLFAELANAQDQSSREGFESAKAYSLGATIMNTAAAIMNAFATVPWPASVAAAALAGATGAIQIATINSAQFGGGGSVRGVSAGYGGSGNAGSSTVTGRGIGAPTRSISDIQTEESLRHLAESSDRAANAINRVADGLTEIGTLFGEGSRGNIYGSQLATAEGQTGKGALPMTGNGQWSMVGTGAAMGAFAGPLGMVIGAVIGGALNGAFGIGNKWVRNATGVNLGMEDGELTGDLWTRYKKEGGLFRKDKYSVESSPLVREMEDTFNGYLGQIMTAISRSAVALGTRTDFGTAQLSSTQIQTSGRSAEDINKDLEAWFTKAADVLAQTTEGLQEFTFQGESAFDAIIRLAVSLQTVDAELELIGARILPATLAAGNAAFLLTEMMGGIEEFQDKVGTYFESMFSDEEQDRRRAAAAAREVGVAFAEMNLSVPATKEGFISIVDSLNLSTERGRALFASLMDVSEAFALVQDHAADMAEQQRESARDLESRYLRVTGKGTMADLIDLINQQQDEYEDYVRRGLDTAKLLQVQQLEYAEAAKEAAETLSQASNELTEAADRLRDKLSAAVSAQINIMTTLQGLLGGNLSTLSPEDKYSQTGAAFRSTYGRARLGDVDAMQAVSQLATEFLNASRGYNASGAGYASDFAEVTQALALLGGLPSDNQIQIDVAQQQLENLKKIQESIVDGNIESASYLKGILGENSGVTVLLEQYLQADAEARLAVLRAQQEAQERALFEQQKATDILNAQQSYEQALATIQSQAQSSMDDAVKAQQLSNSGQYDARYDIAPVVDNISYQPNPNGIVDVNDVVLFLHRHTDVYISKMEEYARSIYEAALADINSRQFVPQYAVGTSYLASDQYAMVHAGEAIIDAQSNAVLQKYGIKVQTSGDNEETVAELKNAVTELKALVRLQGVANQQLIAELKTANGKLARTQTKSILENAA